MEITCREAIPDDLDAIAALTRAHRHRLAGWGPRWWRIADGADDLHPLWLGHLISSDLATVRVALGDGQVVATATAMAQPDGWFIDDLAVDEDARWPLVAPALIEAFPESPALTCVAVGDAARAAALRERGSLIVSSYWIRACDTGVTPTDARLRTRRSAPRDAPPHTFGGAFDPEAPGALAFAGDDGTVVGSPSTPAPPVYDPGGAVTVLDRVYGPDLDALLRTALERTEARGDALVAVVCAPEDQPLASALADGGFLRTVDLHRWPTADG